MALALTSRRGSRRAFGIRPAGRYAVDIDGERSTFTRQTTSHADDGGLGRGVGRRRGQERLASLAGDRADRDYLAPASLFHAWHKRARGRQIALHVDVEDTLVLVVRSLGDAVGSTSAGIADEDVDFAEMLQRLRDHCVDLIRLTRVSLDQQRVAAYVAYGVDHRFAGRAIYAIIDDDVRASLGQEECACAPDSACGASDQGDTPL